MNISDCFSEYEFLVYHEQTNIPPSTYLPALEDHYQFQLCSSEDTMLFHEHTTPIT
ncbi:hypothetical protein Hanom_Chr10g00904631 [Helianthus anomalus]